MKTVGISVFMGRAEFEFCVVKVILSSTTNSMFSIIQFGLVTQSCPTLCDPMDCSMPGLPLHNQLPEFTQTHVHRVGDAIQPSHPLSSPSPPAFNLSQHQGLFKSNYCVKDRLNDILYDMENIASIL